MAAGSGPGRVRSMGRTATFLAAFFMFFLFVTSADAADTVTPAATGTHTPPRPAPAGIQDFIKQLRDINPHTETGDHVVGEHLC